MKMEFNTADILVIGCDRMLSERLRISFGADTKARKKSYGIIVAGEGNIFLNTKISTECFICSPYTTIEGNISCSNALTCGMNDICTLSFSSIKDSAAMLCVGRAVELGDFCVEEGEIPVEYDHNMGIFENIAGGFINTFSRKY